jgi:hypothetical protein
MAKNNSPADAVKVAEVAPRQGVKVGKPNKIVTSAMRMKTAYPMSGGVTSGTGGNFYSPELSTDFLELPQSIDEQRNFIRFFIKHDPFVNRAMRIRNVLPLSKVRLSRPLARNQELAGKALRFCENWARDIGLLRRLMEIKFEWEALGEVNVFCEDTSPDMPREVREQPIREVSPDGELIEKWEPYPDADDREIAWLKKNYRGWTAVRVLPPEQIHMESFPFTNEKIIELVPDSKTKNVIEKARQGDPQAQRIVASMPAEIVNAILQGGNLPLNTDPDAGSFVHHMSRTLSPYAEHGESALEPCLRTLIFRDKVRQSLTSIASRHMTPYRLIYAEDMDDEQTEALREQVDMALQDPDYSIITNFQVNWEEMGADQRLPDWSWVFDLTDRQMYAGLGVTESLLSGEASYSGDRLNLEIINTEFLLDREMMQDLVEQMFFKPMCKRMGFVEEDEDGYMQVIVPRLTFTRLALRDNSDTFDALFNLYQKGSLDVETIYDLFNLDPVTINEKLQKAFGKLADPNFNEVTRALYGKIGDMLADNTEMAELIAKHLNLKYTKPKESERF